MFYFNFGIVETWYCVVIIVIKCWMYAAYRTVPIIT